MAAMPDILFESRERVNIKTVDYSQRRREVDKLVVLSSACAKMTILES